LFLVTALLTSSLLLWPASAQDQPNTAKTKSASCSNDDSGLKLPAGFCATVFADGIGHARHIAVASNGVVYVNTWSGEDYGPAKPPAGGFLVALRNRSVRWRRWNRHRPLQRRDLRGDQ
jgi:hypothetical protein